MRSFDVKLWKDRAVSRYQKRSSISKEDAIEQLRISNTAINQLKIVVDWCETKSISVKFGRIKSGGIYDPSDDSIVISHKLQPKFQLYTLLHEIGHYFIDKRTTSVRTSKGYLLDIGDKDKSAHYKIDLLEEEFEAWRRGRRLGKRLNLKLDEDSFNRYRICSIRTFTNY